MERLAPYLRPLAGLWGKGQEPHTVERLLFHMTDFANCSKVNLCGEGATGEGRPAAATCLSGVSATSDAGCDDVSVTLRVSDCSHRLFPNCEEADLSSGD